VHKIQEVKQEMSACKRGECPVWYTITRHHINRKDVRTEMLSTRW
jgi:hypothetical protein